MFCTHVYSKPLNYAIALNELGSDIVNQYVGQEPSGGKFNTIELDYNSEKLRNKYQVNLLLKNLPRLRKTLQPHGKCRIHRCQLSAAKLDEAGDVGG